MDWRPANLRTRGGTIVGVIDWSNALIGPAVVELYRVLELESPGPEFVNSYTSVNGALPRVTEVEELFLRLDAALMLALVFLSEAPDLDAAKVRVESLLELVRRLGGHLDSAPEML